MPLSVEDMTTQNNFSSNNRIKRSLIAENSDYTVREIVQKLFNVHKGENHFTVFIFGLDLKYILLFSWYKSLLFQRRKTQLIMMKIYC